MATDDTACSSNKKKRALRSAEIEIKRIKVRVGPEYQAVIPDFEPNRRTCNDLEKVCETASWIPSGNYSEKELVTYVNCATKTLKISIDQALAWLLNHNGNINEAMSNITNFTYVSKEIQHQHAKILDKSKNHFVENEFDKGYLKIMRGLKLNSLMDIMHLWKRKQKKEKVIITDMKPKTENPNLELYKGEELLKLYHACGNAVNEITFEQVLDKMVLAINEYQNIKTMIVKCDAEIKLVYATPVEELPEVKVQANWKEEDKALLSLAYADYKDDYEAIAFIIGTKTADQVSEYCTAHYPISSSDIMDTD